MKMVKEPSTESRFELSLWSKLLAPINKINTLLLSQISSSLFGTSNLTVENLHPTFCGKYSGFAIAPKNGTVYVNIGENDKSTLYSYDGKQHKQEPFLPVSAWSKLIGCDSDGNLYFDITEVWIGIRRVNGLFEMFEYHKAQKQQQSSNTSHTSLIVKGKHVYSLRNRRIRKLRFDTTTMKFGCDKKYDPLLPSEATIWDLDLSECAYALTKQHITKIDLNTKTTKIIATDSEDAECRITESGFEVPLRYVNEMKYHRGCLYIEFFFINCRVAKLDLYQKTITPICGGFQAPVSLQYSHHIFPFRNSLYLVACEYNTYLYRVDSVPWKLRRLVWIGKMKESPKDCYLASLPPEIIRFIDSFL